MYRVRFDFHGGKVEEGVEKYWWFSVEEIMYVEKSVYKDEKGS